MEFTAQVKTPKAGLVFQVPVPGSGNVIHAEVSLSISEPEELPNSCLCALVTLEMTRAHI